MLPKSYYKGLLVKVHAGFWHALTAGDFRQQLMAQLESVVAGFNPGCPLRFYFTGARMQRSAAPGLQRLRLARRRTLRCVLPRPSAVPRPVRRTRGVAYSSPLAQPPRFRAQPGRRAGAAGGLQPGAAVP